MFERTPKPTTKSAPVQRAAQAPAATSAPPVSGPAARPQGPVGDLAIHPPRPNRSGLPEGLKSGIEALSGLSMDGVRVHYNSPRPGRLDALAVAQGREIHLAPGEAHHLPHEAWHIVQQAQGRVRRTGAAPTGEGINDDQGLEREADSMGAKAMAHRRVRAPVRPMTRPAGAPIQRAKGKPLSIKPKAPPRAGFKAPKDKNKAVRLGRYTIGQHGAKKAEQRRLSAAYAMAVTGDTHESEHTLGFEPINRSSGLRRGTSGRARRLENIAHAYQERKALHRDHIGTGTHSTPDESGFHSEGYRQAQRSLMEVGDVSSAVQLNQLGYAFDPAFRSAAGTAEGQAATDSFRTMVGGMENVTYASGDMDVEVPVDAKARAEMHLSRDVAQSGAYPTREQENAVRKLYGVEELP
ncbi:MAG TPA: DUF4157 domain-containing protein [Allosphingosinicella sp.]|jgi:hypothetical protein